MAAPCIPFLGGIFLHMGIYCLSKPRKYDSCLVIQSDLFGMFKWPFEGVKWPPTRGWKGHFESPGGWFLFQELTFDPFWLGRTIFFNSYTSGQISSRPNTRVFGPRNGGLVRDIPVFQGNLGWWNIRIWPEISRSICQMFFGMILQVWG